MFSIVIPAYNASATIERAVGSVLAQSSPDFELIVVDDGSTDDTAALVERIADPRIRIVRQKNAGEGAARNAGIAAASNEWVALLDADDFWFEDHLAELDRLKRDHPNAGIVASGLIVVPSGKPAARRGRRRGHASREVRFFREVGRATNPLSASSIALRKSALDKIGGYRDFPSGSDMEFHARMALAFPMAASTWPTAVWMPLPTGLTAAKHRRERGNPPASLSELSPAVATVLDRYDEADPALRHDIDLFVLRYLEWRLRTAIRQRDRKAMRALRELYRGRLPLRHRLLRATAFLPPVIAELALRLSRSTGRL